MDSSNPWGAVDPNILLSTVQSSAAPFQAFQQAQSDSAARAFAIAQNQRTMQQQAIGDAAWKAAMADPSTQNIAALSIARPEAYQAAQSAHNMLDADTQRAHLQELSALQGTLTPDKDGNYSPASVSQAQGLVDQYIQAAKNSGKDPSVYQNLKAMIAADPRTAHVATGSYLAALAGPEKYAEAYGKIGEEGRAQTAEPGKEALAAAQTAEAKSKAALTAQQTEQLLHPNPKTASAGPGPDGKPVFYNENAAPPANSGAAVTTNSGALDGFVQQIQAEENNTGDPAAKNPRSSAMGNGQFVNKTWLGLVQKYRPELMQGRTPEQVLALRADPTLSAQMVAANAQDNAATLGAAGAPVNSATLALAHRLGAADAQRVLAADQNTPLSQVLSPEVIAANPQLAKQSVGSYLKGFKDKYGITPIDATPGDPNATGDDFLKTLPPARARMIQGIANGDIAMPPPVGRSAAQSQLLLQQVQQYDPTASAINLPARKATREAFTKGTQGQSIVQANTVGGHLAALDGLVSTLNNGPVPLFNSIAQGVETAAGVASKQKSVTTFNTLSNTLASELTKFYRNSGGSEKDVDEFRKQLDVANSPVQIHAAIQSIAGAVLSKIGALNDSYNAGMGKVAGGLNLPNVNHNAIARLQQLAGDSGVNFGGDSAPAQAAQTAPPNADQIAHLKANPALASAFDAKFGPGASSRFVAR